MDIEFRLIILFIQTETGEIVRLLVEKLREHSIAYTEEPTAYKHTNKQTNNNNHNTITSDLFLSVLPVLHQYLVIILYIIEREEVSTASTDTITQDTQTTTSKGHVNNLN